MRWLGKIILIIAGNALGLWLANRYIPGFVVNTNWQQLVLIALILALLNAILKPVLTLVFGPIIVLTLGIGIVVVNAAILFILQFLSSHLAFLSGSIMIQSIPALIYATLVLGVINFVIHLGTK
jgi:putative membrane protein